MRSVSSILATVLIAGALLAPSALARPAQDPPSWPADPRPSKVVETLPAESDGSVWQTVALVLVAAGIGAAGSAAVMRVRHRTHPVA
jgi:hypothetical protein